nr:M4 family metallopeptidase [Lysobacter enzymogenes]
MATPQRLATTAWASTRWCTSAAATPKYDPHLASGAANRFARRLSGRAATPAGAPSDDGSGRKNPLARSGDTAIVGIGIGKAKLDAIRYRALTQYFVSSAGYPSARAGTLQAAADLYGNGSVEYQTAARAWPALKADRSIAASRRARGTRAGPRQRAVRVRARRCRAGAFASLPNRDM